MSVNKDAKQSSIQLVIRPLTRIDYTHVLSKGRKALIETMKAALVTSVEITEDML